MTTVVGVGGSAAMPVPSAFVANAQAAVRGAAAAPAVVSFRTLLLGRLAADAERGLGAPPSPFLAPPSPLAASAPAARVAPCNNGPEKTRTGDDDAPDDASGGSAIHRRAGYPDTEAAPTIPPLVLTPPPFTRAVSDSQAAATTHAAKSLEDLLPALVRRIAWSSDGQRGSVRLELGAGELAGATLLVHADAGRVSVHMDVPPGIDAAQWERRLRERLASRGLATDAVEVT